MRNYLKKIHVLLEIKKIHLKLIYKLATKFSASLRLGCSIKKASKSVLTQARVRNRERV
jgi:hypothetical protein